MNGGPCAPLGFQEPLLTAARVVDTRHLVPEAQLLRGQECPRGRGVRVSVTETDVHTLWGRLFSSLGVGEALARCDRPGGARRGLSRVSRTWALSPLGSPESASPVAACRQKRVRASSEGEWQLSPENQ